MTEIIFSAGDLILRMLCLQKINRAAKDNECSAGTGTGTSKQGVRTVTTVLCKINVCNLGLTVNLINYYNPSTIRSKGVPQDLYSS